MYTIHTKSVQCHILVYSELYNHCHKPIFRDFHLPKKKKKSCTHSLAFPIPHHMCWTWETTSLLSVPINLPLLDISFTWIISGLIEVVSCDSLLSLSIIFSRTLISLYCPVTFHCMGVPHFIYPLVLWWHLSCFHFGAIMNIATMRIHVKVFVWASVFISLRYTHWIKISGYYTNATFNSMLLMPRCGPQWLHHFTLSPVVRRGFQVLHILTNIFYYLYFFLLGGMKWFYCGFVSSLMMWSIFSCACWPFVLSSSEKCLVTSFAYF